MKNYQRNLNVQGRAFYDFFGVNYLVLSKQELLLLFSFLNIIIIFFF